MCGEGTGEQWLVYANSACEVPAPWIMWHQLRPVREVAPQRMLRNSLPLALALPQTLACATRKAGLRIATCSMRMLSDAFATGAGPAFSVLFHAWRTQDQGQVQPLMQKAGKAGDLAGEGHICGAGWQRGYQQQRVVCQCATCEP